MTSNLFVQESRGGSLEPVRPGVYRLTLSGVSPSVSTFADRPKRRAGKQGLPDFLAAWGRYGFESAPPKAALVLNGAPSSDDVAMLTLSHPRYERRARRLTYTATPLRGSSARGLAGFARRGDPPRALSFRGARLFIDRTGSDTIQRPISLRVASAKPGRPDDLELTIRGGVPVARSFGIEIF